MRTIGVDLAASAPNTAMAIIDWSQRPAPVELREGCSDREILDAVGPRLDADTALGVDVPLGWPREFQEAITAWMTGERFPDWFAADDPDEQTARLRRAVLLYRPTDWALRGLRGLHLPLIDDELAAVETSGTEKVGNFPLSVAGSLLGQTALRGAGLVTRLETHLGRASPLSRGGSDRLYEIYPAAALVQWRLWRRGTSYKSDQAERTNVVRSLLEQAREVVHLQPLREALCASAHGLAPTLHEGRAGLV